MKKAVIAMCLLGTSVGGGVCAQDETVTGVVVQVPEVRTAPPHGPFHLFVGSKIKDSVKTGDRVKILATNRYYGFKGTHLWHRIEPPDTVESQMWAYAGVAEKRSSLAIQEYNDVPEQISVQ